jgi:hypothetical protein
MKKVAIIHISFARIIGDINDMVNMIVPARGFVKVATDRWCPGWKGMGDTTRVAGGIRILSRKSEI